MRQLKSILIFSLLILFFQCNMPTNEAALENALDEGTAISRVVEAAQYPTWDKSTVYKGGETVTWKGKLYYAKWWTQGNEPGTQQWGPWEEKGPGPVDNEAPSIPAGLAAANVGVTEVTLNWTASTDNVAVTGYKVYNGTAVVADVTAETAKVTGLTAETAYSFTVSAYDAAGNESAQSTAVAVTTKAPVVDLEAPSVPAGLAAANVGATEVTLNWTASTDNVGVVGYKVYNGTDVVVDVTAATAKVTGLTPKTAYSFTVSAYDAAGNESAQSTAVAVTTIDAPLMQEWKVGTAYKLGDVVAYKGSAYKCTYAHTAIDGWQPDNAASLWKYEGNAIVIPKVELTLTASSLFVAPGETVTLTWTSKNATSVVATGAWTGTKAVSGSEISAPITAVSEFTLTASDANGQSVTKSVTVRAGTAPTPKKRIIVGYWHNFDNGSGFIPLRNVSTDFDVICIAFAENTVGGAEGEMSFVPDKATSKAAIQADVAYLQSLGKKVIISIGGANCHIKLTSAAGRDNFIRTMTDIIKTYNFDGMDIDLEGSSLALDAGDTDFRNPTSACIINMRDATRAIMANVGGDFVLSMAPETAYVQGGYGVYGGIWGAYLPLIHALRNEMDYIHVQHYNSGGIRALDDKEYRQGTADFQVAMAEMLLHGFNVGGNPNHFFPPLREDQVAIGLPANKPAAPSGGYIAPAELHKALDYLILGKSFGGQYIMKNPAGYKGFRGLMTWSVNWDAYNNFEFSKSHRAYLDSIK